MTETDFPLVENCAACDTPIDVSNLAPLAEILCPNCGITRKVRAQFDHFTLLKKIGQGGMGAVYQARDEYLQREVALKILRKEISGSEEEQEKLAREAQRTASINNPHVVKVFSFGSALGQFYLAMELVKKGTLDDLMELQGRIPEIQGLDVAIQMASGLDAACQVGLIHRDIKPGNILFVDATTVKLVDFGLALIMDEVAAQKGEIWGTPYYVAPEKLDGGDEDFRSDIYSLGGTIFHALAGRPPYEAESASMVALKQLKSMPICLQTFAPDISDETNYVVNRMLAKAPEDRYQSYAELSEHLIYARQKLAERLASNAPKVKKTIELESRSQNNVIGFIMLSLVVIFLVLGVVGFLNREKLGKYIGLEEAQDKKTTVQGLQETMQEARKLVLQGQLQQATDKLAVIVAFPKAPEPEKRWAILEQAMYFQLAGNVTESAKLFKKLEKDGLYSEAKANLPLGNFFTEMGRFLSQKRPIFNSTLHNSKTDNFEAMGFLLFGINNWVNGNVKTGVEALESFLKTNPMNTDAWIAEYKPIAQQLIAHAPAFAPLQKVVQDAKTPQEKVQALEKIKAYRSSLQKGDILMSQLDELVSKLEKTAK